MSLHLISTTLAIIVARVSSKAIRQLTFKQAFGYILLCRYYKIEISRSRDTTSSIPLTLPTSPVPIDLPENVTSFLRDVLGLSEPLVASAWAASNFREYIWKSYNSRTESQMAERFIHKAAKRGVPMIRVHGSSIERRGTSSRSLTADVPNDNFYDSTVGQSSLGQGASFLRLEAAGSSHRSRGSEFETQRSDASKMTNPYEPRARVASARISHPPKGSYGDVNAASVLVKSSSSGLRHREIHSQAPEITSGTTSGRRSQVKLDNLQVLSADNVSSPAPLPMLSSELLKHVLHDRPHLNLTNKVTHEPSGSLAALGGFADVYKGVYSTDQGTICVAIKHIRLTPGRASDKLMKDSARELRIWSELKHRNILPLLGYMQDKSGYPAFVSRWMEHGSLKDRLTELTRTEALSLSFGIAEGLSYLRSKDVVHADLKSDNVLISPRNEALLTDFGISRMETLSNGYSTVNVKGNSRWQAIEFFQMDGPTPKHTFTTDVWAFGMTIYEMLSRNVPYASIENNNQVIVAVSKGILPSRPKYFETSVGRDNAIEEKLWDICQRCWNSHPGSRPQISDIVAELKTFQESF